MSTDQLLRGLVDTVMHSPVVTVERNATLRVAARALRQADVGILAVMEGPFVAGVLSERDVVRGLADGVDPDESQVASVMSAEPRYVTAGADLSAAAEEMLAAGIRHLPVLDEGELVGIVSMRDLVAVLGG